LILSILAFKAPREFGMTNLEVAREKCMAADAARTECKDKLQSLVSKCASETPTAQPQQAMSEQQLSAFAHLGALLPAELAKGFQEALSHFQGPMQMQPPASDCVDVEVGSVTSGGGSLFGGGVFAPVLSGETSSGHAAGLSQPSSISSMSSGAKAAGGIVLPSGWGRGRGRPAIDPMSPSGVDKRSRSKGEEALGRSDSTDSG
jgi:hypothetical protein